MDVLLVEDDRPTRQLIASLLEELGDNVIEAVDGQQAWEILQQHPVPLVITDWKMPRLDGRSLIHRIREANFDHYTYIVMLTARGISETTADALEAGSDDYLVKPFDPSGLQERVAVGKRILSQQQKMRIAHARGTMMISYDEVTGLLSRHALTERASAVLAYAQRVGQPAAFALASIDNLAPLAAQSSRLGNQALKHVALLLRQGLRPYDVVGRWSDDCFLLFLRSTTLQEAAGLANEIREQLAQKPLELPDGRLAELHLSFGLTASAPGVPLDTLVWQADQALRQAQRRGGNQVQALLEAIS